MVKNSCHEPQEPDPELDNSLGIKQHMLMHPSLTKSEILPTVNEAYHCLIISLLNQRKIYH